ncbi:hypothetical protein HMPREF1986_01991 [Oribacterium sp. oral taxon 078 str. F0263]|nr:hypothetical protein HMPREF1986_01991 [Oribacterium sp. oral taxon 078 str. F0263]
MTEIRTRIPPSSGIRGLSKIRAFRYTYRKNQDFGTERRKPCFHLFQMI